ncbi:outer membrane protein assembly complex, YaeT protein, partial [human gut metagenome]
MNYSGKLFLAAAALVLSCSNIFAQEPQDSTAVETPAFPEDAPMFKTDGTPKLYYIRNVNIHGVKYLNHEMLKSSAGLIAGDSIY